MWPQPITKESCIPVVRKPFGFVQRSSYLNPDLYHEEVVEVEMDSPWVSQVRAGTQVYTFVLLGDQNAGKSTFLHGFTYSQDNHWLEIASVLPILSSSFINTRFSPATIATDGDEGDTDADADAGQPATTTSPKVAAEWLPRDELPFLDTDVARSHILLTRDDFAFWIDEVGLPLPSEILPPELGGTVLPKNMPAYVMIQFIEIGGDHLDSMMCLPEFQLSSANTNTITSTPNTPVAANTVDILRRSVAFLLEAKKTVYFVNMRTLFKRCDAITGYCFDDEQFERFRRRLDFISDTLQRQPQHSSSSATTSPLASQHLVLLCLSRIPRDFAITRDTLHERLTKVTPCQHQPDTKYTSAPETKDDDFVGAAIKSMRWLADQMTIRRGWCFQIQDVVPCLHVNEDDGSLNADRLLGTLSNLFRTSLSSIQSTPDTFVAKHIIQCFKQAWRRVHEKDQLFDLFVDKKCFGEYLEHLHHDVPELPEPLLLQSFDDVCRSLARNNLALLLADKNFSSITMSIQVVPDTVTSGTGMLQKQILRWQPSSVGGSTARSHHVSQHFHQLAIRFPYYSPLLTLMENYLSRNIPAEFWLNSSSTSFGTDEFLSKELQRVLIALESVIAAKWASVFSSNPNTNNGTASNNIIIDLEEASRIVWLLEDWWLGRKLLGYQYQQNDARSPQHTSLAFQFPAHNSTTQVPSATQRLTLGGQNVLASAMCQLGWEVVEAHDGTEPPTPYDVDADVILVVGM